MEMAPPAPPSDKPAKPVNVEDGIRFLAAWVSQNYSGMGKTVEDVLPGACVRGFTHEHMCALKT